MPKTMQLVPPCARNRADIEAGTFHRDRTRDTRERGAGDAFPIVHDIHAVKVDAHFLEPCSLSFIGLITTASMV